MQTSLKPLPPALPTTMEDHLKNRQLKSKRTLNDIVEDIHLSLVEDKAYLAFLYAVYDEQAVEGSLSADNIMAAEMIRDKAKKTGNEEVVKEKLATIAKVLGIVLRRYDFDRRTRRNMIRGEVVPDGNGE